VTGPDEPGPDSRDAVGGTSTAASPTNGNGDGQGSGSDGVAERQQHLIAGTDARVLTLAIARMADAVGNSFLIIVLPLYIASDQVVLDGLVGGSILGVPIGQEFLIGVVLSLFGLLNSFGQPFTGRLSDRLGKRRVFVLFGLAVFGVGSAAYPLVDSYWWVLLARALQGIGAAFTVPATVALVNEYAASPDERGGNFGVFNTFRLLGFGFGPIVAGAVVTGGFGNSGVVDYVLPAALGPLALPAAVAGATVSGFTAAFGVAVAGAVISFVLVVLLIEDPPGLRAAAAEDLAGAVRVFDATGRHRFDSVFALGVGTFLMATTIALFATLAEPIQARLNEGPFLFGVQFAAVVLANVALQVPVGRASDRHGRRPFVIWGFVLLVPAVLAQGYVTTPMAMLAARLVQGVAVALVFAPSMALAGDLADGRSGSVLSVLTASFGLGVALGPFAAGVLFEVGGITAPFIFGGALAVIALVMTYTQVEESLPDVTNSGAAPAVD
jgi:MFS family permease